MERLDIKKFKSVLGRGNNYLTLAIAFVIMMLFYPIEGKFKYHYKKGAPWIYQTLDAPIDFPILKTAQELADERNAAASSIVPYYTLNSAVASERLADFSAYAFRNNIAEGVQEAVNESLKKIYSVGVLPENSLTDKTIFVQRGKSASEEIETDLYTVGKAARVLKADLQEVLPGGYNVDSLLAAIGLETLLVPNLSYDNKTTEDLHRQAVNYISPTKGMVYTGQHIISEGETVTAETEQLLDSFKAEYQTSIGFSGAKWTLHLGHAIAVIAILLLLYIAIYFSDIEILRKLNKFNFVFFICVVNFVLPVLVRRISPDLVFLVPFALSTLFLTAFLWNRVVLPVYLVSLLPLVLIFESGVELYLLSAVGGALAFMTFSFFERGWKQFLNCLYVFVAMLAVHVGFILISGGSPLDARNLHIALYLFISSLLLVILYPFVFLLEKMFYMVSSSTLRDLSDADTGILRELEQKAPGTFQHSLRVSHMAERAVMAIGGRSRLVRVGALYHDIGKLANPQAFTENQAPGVNYHASLTPMESAQIIISHVSDGLKLAKKYKLPQAVQDFISSHHARTLTEYFYTVYCNNGGDPANKEPFTYHGTLPQTKEEVVVMMADAVEAASRSLKDYTSEKISELVDRVVSKRLEGNQLDHADISLKEINTVKRVFKKQLQEIYHARIAYPKLNQEK